MAGKKSFKQQPSPRQGKRIRTGVRLETHLLKVLKALVRQDMNLSRGLAARYLRTNVPALENWEQGRAKPNAQAALLIRMVQRFPDTVRRLAEI
jgi:putative transcriptional regulator